MSLNLISARIFSLLILIPIIACSQIYSNYVLFALIPLAIFYGIQSSSFNTLLNPLSKSKITTYDDKYAGEKDQKLEHKPQDMTDLYYDLATDFYIYGWGQSFHFAPRLKGEGLKASIARLEHFMALKGNITSDKKVLDMGCGVGGPMRCIAKLTGADVTGITINDYQVKQCNQLTPKYLKNAKCVQGDFTDLSQFADGTFDVLYAFEASVHVNPRKKQLEEAFRVLKKGGSFVQVDWILTPKYDKNNKEHLTVKRSIEHGNGLPDLITIDEVLADAKEVGFELTEQYDMIEESNQRFGRENNVTWYYPLQSSYNLEQWKSTKFGTTITTLLLIVLETLHLAPKGSLKTQEMLLDGAVNLVKGGEMEIFTPSHFIALRKN